MKLLKLSKIEVEDIVRYVAENFTIQEIKQLLRELTDVLEKKFAE